MNLLPLGPKATATPEVERDTDDVKIFGMIPRVHDRHQQLRNFRKPIKCRPSLNVLVVFICFQTSFGQWSI